MIVDGLMAVIVTGGAGWDNVYASKAVIVIILFFDID
jgi:hypothetical protein